jgi:hypothetical protein
MTRAHCAQFVGALLLTLLVTAGCAADPEPTLIDETGAVQEWQFRFLVEDAGLTDEESFEMEERGAVTAQPSPGWNLRIVWGASFCHTAPEVRVRGNAGEVTEVYVDHGPRVVGPYEGCGDALMLHAVDIRAPRSSLSAVTVSGTT